MIVRKPSILIYGTEPDKDLLREICAGIEEEGVLYEVIGRDSSNPDQLAYEAAMDSMLGTGIGICGSHAVMQMKGLKMGQNVFELNHPSFFQCRALGTNSARAVKRNAFKEI